MRFDVSVEHQPVTSVEFLNADDEPDHEPVRGRYAPVLKPSRSSVTVSAVLSLGAAVCVISLFLTQFRLQLLPFGDGRETYDVDAFGHFHLDGRASSREVLAGPLPALGWVVIVGALIVLVAVAAILWSEHRPRVRAALVGLANLGAGAMAATAGCQVIVWNSQRHTWAIGFWLLVLGSGLACLGALVATWLCAVRAAPRPDHEPIRSS